jgi:PDZ domain-containing protein
MRKIIKIAVTALVIGSLLILPRTGYHAVMPGSAEDLSRLVRVDNSAGVDEGTFFLVTVRQQPAPPALFLYALLNPTVELRERRQMIPPGMDPAEYEALLQRMMRESQDLAKVIALRRLGYNVTIESDGVEVVEVGADSPARGMLEPGDIILAVDGQRVVLVDELISRIQRRRVGDPVTLTIRRGALEQEVSISTTRHVEMPEKAAIQVLVQTLNWSPQLPIAVEIETGDISGPSAGLMFVLEILNQLDPGDLTGGRLIAGTGTISLKEEIGGIGGVRQKVVAAEKAGARYFLLPVENCEEARPFARQITLVPVSNLSQVLEFLGNLRLEGGNQ